MAPVCATVGGRASPCQPAGGLPRRVLLVGVAHALVMQLI